MTICIAAASDDSKSLVLASDALWTSMSLSLEFEHPLEKMTLLAPGCVALTAGDALAHIELFRAVKGRIEEGSVGVSAIVNLMVSEYRRLRNQRIEGVLLARSGFDSIEHFQKQQRILLPDVVLGIQQRIDNFNYGLDVIVAGMDRSTTHIYGISNPGVSLCFDAMGFHAIGSGLPHAVTTLIGRGCNQFISLRECLMYVYEAKKMAEKAPGVGDRTTHMMIIRGTEGHKLEPEEIKRVSDSYEKWRKNERNWEAHINELLEGGSSPRTG